MSSYQFWFSTAVFFEIVFLGLLLALPVLWIRTSNLRLRDDPHLYWKLLLSAILFALGAVAGIRVLERGFGVGIDHMTVWFLPAMGALYLHVQITHQVRETLEIGLFFLLISYPAALARSWISTFLFSIPV